MLLKAWRAEGDSKVLVFSRSVRLLDILEKVLTVDGYSHKRLDGDTPAYKRTQDCADFNCETAAESFVFLISTRA